MTEKILPLLALRDLVHFPGVVVTIDVGREKSIAALQAAIVEAKESNSKDILLATQKDDRIEDPKLSDLYQFGTVSTILQMIRLPGNVRRLLLEGKGRAKILQARPRSSGKGNKTEEKFLRVAYSIQNTKINVAGAELKALHKAVINDFEKYVKSNDQLPSDLLTNLIKIQDPVLLVDSIVHRLPIALPEKQRILEIPDLRSRYERLFVLLENEIEYLEMEKRIRKRVKSQMDKTQREYYLNEQMKALQKELGNGQEPKEEQTDIATRIEKSGMSKEAKRNATNELRKLKQMPAMSAEATVVRNYLDWLTDIPWKKTSRIRNDLTRAEAVLQKGHYGLEKIKERILEYLAVQQRHRLNRRKPLKGTVLCLVGPPGVGKTSLGHSIAEATGRKFVRMSLGGVRDEAEIRGHRRTYIGSMPGKIIQGMKKAGTVNPLFLLDEIDKLGTDWRGDPASALLEVLDPEQNNTFNDHYLEVDYDLSQVMFITTANTMNMPPPLLDRMEILELSGYTEDEKTHIARNHLLGNLITENGIKDNEFAITDEAILALIRNYTREAGVRNLERELSALMRKTIRNVEIGKQKRKLTITNKNLSKYAGVWKYRYGLSDNSSMIGMTTGLAWTGVGGELLTIEAVRMPGKGNISQTGKLGDVMRESIQAAENYIKSRAPELGLSPQRFARTDIHVHVPEGSTPKDGPSAGVAMITSIISALTDNPVRHDLAMTGEITLRGRILPIGGLKEKLLAAQRGNIKIVLIPKENERHLAEISDSIKKSLKIIPVASVNDVLKNALLNPIKPLSWDAGDEALAAQLIAGGGPDTNPGAATTH